MNEGLVRNGARRLPYSIGSANSCYLAEPGFGKSLVRGSKLSRGAELAIVPISANQSPALGSRMNPQPKAAFGQCLKQSLNTVASSPRASSTRWLGALPWSIPLSPPPYSTRLSSQSPRRRPPLQTGLSYWSVVGFFLAAFLTCAGCGVGGGAAPAPEPVKPAPSLYGLPVSEQANRFGTLPHTQASGTRVADL